MSRLIGVVVVVAGLFALAGGVDAQEIDNTLTHAERATGWRLLFDGTSLDGWVNYHTQGEPHGWDVVDGTLHRAGRGGDIMTVDQFSNFELMLEWKTEPGGNSGVFYLGVPGSEYIHWSAPEYQVLDDERHPDGGDPLTSAGSNYALHPAPRGIVRPAGEWNQTRIVVRDGHVEHWLNGHMTVAYELGSPDWAGRVADSKFGEHPEYGQARTGHIGLQDHGDHVWFRNLKIRELR